MIERLLSMCLLQVSPGPCTFFLCDKSSHACTPRPGQGPIFRPCLGQKTCSCLARHGLLPPRREAVCLQHRCCETDAECDQDWPEVIVWHQGFQYWPGLLGCSSESRHLPLHPKGLLEISCVSLRVRQQRTVKIRVKTI